MLHIRKVSVKQLNAYYAQFTLIGPNRTSTVEEYGIYIFQQWMHPILVGQSKNKLQSNHCCAWAAQISGIKSPMLIIQFEKKL